MAVQPQSSKSPFSLHTVNKAVDDLLYWLESQAKPRKSQLLKYDYIYLVLTLLEKPLKVPTEPYAISLPNPLHSYDSSEFCVIIDDRPKSSLTAESAQNKLQSEKIHISKIVEFSKLKFKYYPSVRDISLSSLSWSYDLFFTDKRIAHLLPKWLAIDIFKRNIPVDLKHKNWKQQIEGACGSALLFLGTGTCSTLKVGRVSQGRDAIVANVIATIDGVAELVPNKWGGIQSFCLEFPDSISFPVYQIVPEIGLKIEGVKKEKGEKKIDSQAESGEKTAGRSKRKIINVRSLEVDDTQVLDDIFSGKEVDDKENTDKIVELDDFELKGKKKKVEKLKKKDAMSSDVKDINEKEFAKFEDINEAKEAEEEPTCVLIEEDDEKAVWVRCNKRFYHSITFYKEELESSPVGQEI